MPLTSGLPSGGGGTSVESVGGRQLDSHVGFVPRLTVRLLDRPHANVGGWPVIVSACKRLSGGIVHFSPSVSFADRSRCGSVTSRL